MGGGNALICGNGPSLKNINYKRLPQNYDVFRCNQFYFEEKYYVGKNIKYAFFNPQVFFEQYYTAKKLIYNQEYNIENIICSSFDLALTDNPNLIKLFPSYFCDAILGYKILNNIKDFFAFIKYNEIYEKKRITSGIYMCAIAVALGYKNIYLTGIDFYDDKNNLYSFKMNQKNISCLIPEFKNNNYVYEHHSKEFDLQALFFLKEKYDINFYSLNENNKINQYINLAAYNNNKDFLLESKTDNYINDILLPPETSYSKFLKQEQKRELKQNIYYRLLKDLLRLPSNIKHYVRDNYGN